MRIKRKKKKKKTYVDTTNQLILHLLKIYIYIYVWYCPCRRVSSPSPLYVDSFFFLQLLWMTKVDLFYYCRVMCEKCEEFRLLTLTKKCRRKIDHEYGSMETADTTTSPPCGLWTHWWMCAKGECLLLLFSIFKAETFVNQFSAFFWRFVLNFSMVKRYSHAIYMAKSNGEKIFLCRRKIFFCANIVFTVFDPTDASVWNITCFYFFKNFFSLSPGNFYAIMSFLAPNTRYFTYILLLNIRLFGRKYFGHKNRKKTLEILSYWCPVL